MPSFFSRGEPSGTVDDGLSSRRCRYTSYTSFVVVWVCCVEMPTLFFFFPKARNRFDGGVQRHTCQTPAVVLQSSRRVLRATRGGCWGRMCRLGGKRDVSLWFLYHRTFTVQFFCPMPLTVEPESCMERGGREHCWDNQLRCFLLFFFHAWALTIVI